MIWRRLARWLLLTVAVVVGVPLVTLAWLWVVIELAKRGLMPF